jgi:hypothetical protein
MLGRLLKGLEAPLQLLVGGRRLDLFHQLLGGGVRHPGAQCFRQLLGFLVGDDGVASDRGLGFREIEQALGDRLLHRRAQHGLLNLVRQTCDLRIDEIEGENDHLMRGIDDVGIGISHGRSSLRGFRQLFCLIRPYRRPTAVDPLGVDSLVSEFRRWFK